MSLCFVPGYFSTPQNLLSKQGIFNVVEFENHRNGSEIVWDAADRTLAAFFGSIFR